VEQLRAPLSKLMLRQDGEGSWERVRWKKQKYTKYKLKYNINKKDICM
jgi:hypothetical protein